MKTPICARIISSILERREWNQGQLARRSGLTPSLVSWHLTRQRPIRDQHLVRYMRALSSSERREVTAAWLQDVAGPNIAPDLVSTDDVLSVRDEVKWIPDIRDAEKQKMINWWIRALERDPELLDVFEAISRRAGYRS